MRRIATGILLAGLVAVVAACEKSEDMKVWEHTYLVNTPAVIELAGINNNPQLNQRILDYEKAHPGVTIEIMNPRERVSALIVYSTPEAEYNLGEINDLVYQ